MLANAAVATIGGLGLFSVFVAVVRALSQRAARVTSGLPSSGLMSGKMSVAAVAVVPAALFLALSLNAWPVALAVFILAVAVRSLRSPGRPDFVVDSSVLNDAVSPALAMQMMELEAQARAGQLADDAGTLKAPDTPAL